MAIEIGSLVVKGRFGPPGRSERETQRELAQQMAEMRRDLLDEMREIMAEAAQRPVDR
ncbi:hypothetical protein So717_24390 [Roseobacter cerasinus]|uniref:Uncharacterized protein n=1 Tax=Roseobacter cerasinus TaxID=2602289 RepID=A0A640VWS1_9RHOB|nr:hypothetical protein [Roseobacter cerasinus]GFE50686.1 hypothetical protein So717_24390 [Roseobacter cerasinus]